MNFPWMTFINFGAISAAPLVATLLRARIKFLQKYLIPNVLTAGFPWACSEAFFLSTSVFGKDGSRRMNRTSGVSGALNGGFSA